MSKVFLYTEYQTTVAFSDVNWNEVTAKMKQFKGLVSKTWLSGINT
jgi:hypothetical protein